MKENKKTKAFILASDDPAELKDIIGRAVIPAGREVEGIAPWMLKGYEEGEHWHNQPHVLIFKSDETNAAPVDGLLEVYAFPCAQPITLHLVHYDRGMQRENFSEKS